MATIKELPTLERPREKALRYGANSLSDAELLSLLLGKGYRENNILEISTTLLSKYKGLVGLLNVPVSELKKNKGIKDVGALKITIINELFKRICSKLYSSENVIVDEKYLFYKYSSQFFNSNQEHLVLVVLDKRKHIIYETYLYKGTHDSVFLEFSEIKREIEKCGGNYFYLIHNHPNGDCRPSEDDIMTSIQIMGESKRVNLPLIDHLIIGTGSYYSFKKMKKINISY